MLHMLYIMQEFVLPALEYIHTTHILRAFL